MIEEKVIGYFEKVPHLKVLFFFDKDQEYLNEVKNFKNDSIHVEFYEKNPFTIKCKLLDELKDKKVLLYLTQEHPNNQDSYHAFPLMGLLIANKELQLDDVGGFMEEYALQRHQKSLVSKYIGELKHAGTQQVCKPILTAENFDEPKLIKGLMSSFLKFKQIESWSILVAKLLNLAVGNKPADFDRVQKKIESLGLESQMLEKVEYVTGVHCLKLDRENLVDAARGVLYNRLTFSLDKTLPDDPYSNFKITDRRQITRLNQMIHEIDRQPNLKTEFEFTMQEVAKDIRGDKLVALYGEQASFAEYNSEMIWAIMSSFQTQLIETPSEAIKKLEEISLQASLEKAVVLGMDFMVQASKVHEQISKIKNYILNQPEEYLADYTEKWFRVDTNYRRAILAFKALELGDIPKGLSMESIHQELNIAYEKHTDQLNREWLSCLNHFDFDYAKIKAPKQFDFFQNELADADQKVVVIISDALRFEAGNELISEMHGDAKNTAELRYMLASIPSKTNVGMTQLLPGQNKTFNGLEISIDAISSSGTENRTKILQANNPDSIAIQFAELEGLNQEEKRAIFKKSLVYVYHDVIDSTGDKRASERRTFTAVKESINELKKLVKTLHATMNVAKVFVTADHGFLYNEREIEDKDKENIEIPKVIQSHNRYVISDSKEENKLGYSIPIASTTCFKDSNQFVHIPKSVNRYKKQGVGHQFVHGGGSLQELVVPLIESSRKRTEVTQKVNPMLIDKKRLRVVSNILKVNILQEHEVSRTEKERTIQVGLYKENTLVSNLEKMVLNSTSEAPTERLFRAELTLSPDAANESFLKLKCFDLDDQLNAIIDERVQNLTLIQTDF